MDIKIAREVAARIWCDQEMSSIEMDAVLAEDVAQLLSSRLTRREADGAESLDPQWICMTCKTVIGPVVDDDEHRCNCKDDYLIELWRVAPIVETPRRLR